LQTRDRTKNEIKTYLVQRKIQALKKLLWVRWQMVWTRSPPRPCISTLRLTLGLPVLLRKLLLRKSIFDNLALINTYKPPINSFHIVFLVPPHHLIKSQFFSQSTQVLAKTPVSPNDVPWRITNGKQSEKKQGIYGYLVIVLYILDIKDIIFFLCVNVDLYILNQRI
jgi:hypothetical protein